MVGENLTRRDLFKLFAAGKKGLKGVPRSPDVIEEGFFQTLYECDGCAKVAIARLAQDERSPTQCPIHGQSGLMKN
ncbi:MAG: hypothetical protein KGL31_07435 [candidate division NC10 bacterium]|nr:hypothetical protein [candidate division NC10 bacterium]MDE2321734.1 hypothetical protein [candidate division NC10 bacterium]